MAMHNFFKRVRAAMGNAVVWGIGWAGLAVGVFVALKTAGGLPATVSWLDSVAIAVRFGVIGGVAGAAFSAVVGVVYRGTRLGQISPLRFGIGGGAVAGVFVPLFLQAMNLLSGDGLVPMGLVLDDSLRAAVFGAVVAGGTLYLARRGDAALPGGRQDRPELLASGERVSGAEGRETGRRYAHAPHAAAE